MIDELKPYPAMKESGTEWLREVPEHWKLQALGRIGHLFKGKGGNKTDELLAGVPCVRYGDLYTKHEFFVSATKACVSEERAADYTPIQYGDILFAASGETIEEIGRSAVNLMRTGAVCGGDILVLRPKVAAVPKFLGYALDSRASRHQKARMGRGFTVVHIYGSQLKRLALPLPPLPEQAAIVRFLDHADRRIRHYIRAKQKLIKLLEEQKQAIIHQAVTQGLDPGVRLKDSGVEWLGKVPVHWRVCAFSRLAVERADYRGATPRKTDGGKFLVTARNVRKGWIDYETSKEYVAEEEYSIIMRRGLPRTGDLLLTTEAPLGHAALVDREDIALAQRIIRFRFDPKQLHPRFALHAVLSPYFQRQLHRRATGSTALGIKASKLPQLRLLCPPSNEQARILAHVEAYSRPLEVSIKRATHEISVLGELRTRLIDDVVTGKLDVRDAAARLPDDEPCADEDDDLIEDEASHEHEDSNLDADLEPVEA